MTENENEYEKQANDFLSKYQIKFSIDCSNTKNARWEPSGEHFIVQLTKKNPRKQITFDFWGSVNDMENQITPNAYDVLACISGDCSFTDKEDVISEFGYEFYDDAERIASFGRKLNKFFTEQEIEDLSEIR